MAAEALGGKLLGEVEVGSLEEVSDSLVYLLGWASRLEALIMSMSRKARHGRWYLSLLIQG
jgi:hypothetical protein